MADLSQHVNNLTPEAKDALYGGLRSKAQEILQMPAGAEKDARQAKYDKFLQDLGPGLEPSVVNEAAPVENALAHGLDTLTGAGLSRAAIGETGLALAGKGNLKRAALNVGRGLNPIPTLTENVPSFAEYGKEAGLPVESPWAKIPLMAADFLSPSLPGAIEGGLGKMGIMSKAAAAEKAAQMAAESGDLAAAKAAHAAQLEAAPKNGWQHLGNIAQDYLTGQRGEALGEGIQKARFSTADKANQLAGKLPFSDTWNKYGSPGFSANGVETGMQNVIENLKNAIQGTTKDVAEVAPQVGAKGMGDVLAPLYSSENRAKAMTLGSTSAYKNATKTIEDHARDLLNNDESFVAQHARAMEENPTVPKDILEYAQTTENYPLNAEQLRRSASGMQGEAKAQGAYNMESPAVKAERKAAADLAHQVGNKARDLEQQTIESLDPALAAKTFGQYKDTTSALGGLNNISEGAPKFPAMMSVNPLVGLTKQAIKHTVDPSALTLSKLLKSSTVAPGIYPYTWINPALNAYRAKGIEESGINSTQDLENNPWAAMRFRNKMETQ